jgi:hypothetical protein
MCSIGKHISGECWVMRLEPRQKWTPVSWTRFWAATWAPDPNPKMSPKTRAPFLSREVAPHWLESKLTDNHIKLIFVTFFEFLSGFKSTGYNLRAQVRGSCLGAHFRVRVRGSGRGSKSRLRHRGSHLTGFKSNHPNAPLLSKQEVSTQRMIWNYWNWELESLRRICHSHEINVLQMFEGRQTKCCSPFLKSHGNGSVRGTHNISLSLYCKSKVIFNLVPGKKLFMC